MPPRTSRPPGPSSSGEPGRGEPGKPAHGRLLALIKRKPLEAIGAAAGVAVIVLALHKRHQNAGSQSAPGAFIAPGPGTGPQSGGPAPGGSGTPGPGLGGIEAQIEAIQDQLDQLDRARHPRPEDHDRDDRRRRNDHDRDDRRRRGGGGTGPPTRRHRGPRQPGRGTT